MKLIIFTCECLLDHLVRMTEDEIEKYIINHEMFSLSNRWLMYIHSQNNVLFFCLRCLIILRPFVCERIFCMKRSGLFMIHVWTLLILVVLTTLVKIVFKYLLLV